MNRFNTNAAPPSYGAATSLTTSGPFDRSQPLRFSHWPLLFLAVYLPLLVVPWVLVCYVDWRTSLDTPIALGMNTFDKFQSWLDAARVINIVAALVAVPFTSAIVARAAVVYASRRHAKQRLTVSQLFALADRRWEKLFPSHDIKFQSSFLYLATLLFLLVILQPPLQAYLVTPKPRAVLTCDTFASETKWSPDCSNGKVKIASDPEPRALEIAGVSRVARETVSRLVRASPYVEARYLWPPGMTAPTRSKPDGTIYSRGIDAAFYQRHGNSSIWVSAVPSNTSTELIRQHAVRLNSTVNCEKIDRAEFPTTCGGAMPFTANFTLGAFDAKICSPGSFREIPWASNHDRQDLSEELFIDYFAIPEVDYPPRPSLNYTIRCTGRTTRAYFELPNRHIGRNASGLLERWPSNESIADFHDYTNTFSPDWTRGQIQPRLSWEYTFGATQGPLKMAALALFGDDSYLAAIAKLAGGNMSLETASLLCEDVEVPFGAVSFPRAREAGGTWSAWFSGQACYNSPNLAQFQQQAMRKAHVYMQGFGIDNIGEDALGLATYAANEATLFVAANDTDSFRSGQLRYIYRVTGSEMNAPSKSLATTVAISAMIGLQVLVLCALVAATLWLPRWTETLDATAMATVGAQLAGRGVDFPPMGRAEREDFLATLMKEDGLVGLIVHGTNDDALAGGTVLQGGDIEMANMSAASSSHPAHNASSDVQASGASDGGHTEASTLHPTEPATSAHPSVNDAAAHRPPAPNPGGLSTLHPRSSVFHELDIDDEAASAIVADGNDGSGGGGLASLSRTLSPPPEYLEPSAVDGEERRGRRPPPRKGDYEVTLGGPGLVTRRVWSSTKRTLNERESEWRRELVAERRRNYQQAIASRQAEVRSQAARMEAGEPGGAPVR